MRFRFPVAIFILLSFTFPTATSHADDDRAFGFPWRRVIMNLARHVGRDATKVFLRPLVRGYIEFMRDIVRQHHGALTADEKTFLREFFPTRLLDTVRVIELGVAGVGAGAAGAAAYGADLIVVRRGYRTPQILKHEMVHVCQYDKLGLAEFARRYADQWVDADFVYRNVPFEAEAHTFKLRGHGPFAGLLGPCE